MNTFAFVDGRVGGENVIESSIFADDKDGVLDGRRCRHTLDRRVGRGTLGGNRERCHGGNRHGARGRRRHRSVSNIPVWHVESSPLSGARDNAIVADDDCLEVTLQ